MTRPFLATMALSLLLALPAMAQTAAAPAQPAEKPVPIVPTAEAKALPATPVKATVQPPSRALTEQEKQLAELLQKNRLIGGELVALRTDILKSHPEVKEKIEAGRAESNEMQKKAAELFRQARELERQAAQINSKVAEQVYGEVSPEYAAKNKEQEEVVAEIWKLKNEIAATRKTNTVVPSNPPRPHQPVRPRVTPAAPIQPRTEAKTEEKAEAKTEEKAAE